MALVLTLSGMARPAFANDLVPPPGYYSEVRHNSRLVRPCTPSPVPFTEALDFPSKYEGSGKSRNILNEESSERYKTLTKPISDMEKGAVKLTASSIDFYAGAGHLMQQLPNTSTHTGIGLPHSYGLIYR
ncbi:MAG: hypothetical protein EOO38_11465 [Cytophagaceae bacterium]|nr:MAG: hypothetical protein EOO38_11465 [Cytophagaceae bacterium]